MQTLLQINSSLFSEQGHSARLAQGFVDAWRRAHPQGQVILRDLAREPVPHLTAERFQALLTPAESRSAEQQSIAAFSDALIDELERADLIVLGLPMYNFGVSSILKAYFDHVARAGITFRYTETGPVGLLRDRPVHVLATRGGAYRGTDKDTQTAYVRHFLEFIGLRDIHFVYAEGLNRNPDIQQAALAAAEAEIARIAA